jgi:hypothetical protein
LKYDLVTLQPPMTIRRLASDWKSLLGARKWSTRVRLWRLDPSSAFNTCARFARPGYLQQDVNNIAAEGSAVVTHDRVVAA